MSAEFSDRHIRALRDVDQSGALDDATLRRIERRMLAAYEHTLAAGSSPGSEDHRSTVVVELSETPPPTSRPPISRWVLAAAAAALVVVAVAVGLLGSVDDSVDVAGPGVDSELVADVRAWCAGGLDDLDAALAAVAAGPDGSGREIAVLSALADASQGLFDMLDTAQRRAGTRRLDEVGRITGEAAQLVAADDQVDAAAVADLVNRFADELAITSDRATECEIAS